MMGALPHYRAVDNPREAERVVCDACKSTAVVETQNQMRERDWPTCHKRDCSERGQVMRLELAPEIAKRQAEPKRKRNGAVGGLTAEEGRRWQRNHEALRKSASEAATERARERARS